MWPTEIKENCRRVPTGLACPKGKVLLSSIKGQLSDGLWENSPTMEGYWKFFCIDDEGGDVTICISKAGHQWVYGHSKIVQNKFCSMTDKQILERFASWIWRVAREEAADWPSSGFKLEKGNEAVSEYLGGSGNELTGGDIWSLRKQLLAQAKGL